MTKMAWLTIASNPWACLEGWHGVAPPPHKKKTYKKKIYLLDETMTHILMIDYLCNFDD